MTRSPESPVEVSSATPASGAGAAICTFGKHAGQPYAAIPASYLDWMVQVAHSHAAYAAAELERRRSEEVQVSGEAIDGLSRQCLAIWDDTRFTGEGLHEWARRQGAAALKAGVRDHDGRLHHLGVVWVIEAGSQGMVLKSAWAERPRSAVGWNDRVRSGAIRHERTLKARRSKL
jgi:hypothetical protein